MNNAIIALTRGYVSRNRYDTLLKRNECIYKVFGAKYPVILFHEGNINEMHQNYIKMQTPALNIIFTDISSVWKGGYEGMCRFNSLDVFEFCKEYDYVLRIDEDCHIEQLNGDPFESVGDNVYLKSLYWGESHSETNATLPQAIEKLTGVSREEFYNNKFPYTNIGLSKVSFWLSEPVKSVLTEISTCKEQRDNRWGDLPIHGSLLNIYAKGMVGTIQGLVYNHLSHGFKLNSEGLIK